MSIEKSINQFNTLINELEDSNLDIDKAVTKYSSALKLASEIKKSLNKVEESITILKKEHGHLLAEEVALD
ncbi:exodeoxyribonuclease VII small subunit [Candidatus Margulisiibacteriota bacterium]